MRIYPIFITHQGCPFQCVYCNQNAITNDYKINWEQILSDVNSFCTFNTIPKKNEIAFFGGTFTALPINIQQMYFDKFADFLPKIHGFRLSTRPDCINDKILQFLKKNKVSTIELGVQSLNDSVLKKSKRGYLSSKVISASKLIKKYGFDLGIQLMPGLPGSSFDTILESTEKAIKINPQFVRIYPTIVIKNTELENLYKNGDFTPLTLEESIQITVKMLRLFNYHKIKVIKIGLHSEISKNDIVAGPFHQSFGEIVKGELLLDSIIADFYKNQLIKTSSKNLSLVLGHNQRLLNKVKNILKKDKIKILIDNVIKEF
jgi:histone acetyltransferase (RNA polymerase elongator complex component)